MTDPADQLAKAMAEPQPSFHLRFIDYDVSYKGEVIGTVFHRPEDECWIARQPPDDGPTHSVEDVLGHHHLVTVYGPTWLQGLDVEDWDDWVTAIDERELAIR